MTAEPVAAHGATPASFDISAMPATAQTLPGTYLPRLETVQMRAAVQPSSRWPQPASMRRHATIRMAYMSQTRSTLRRIQPGWTRHSRGWVRSWSQLLARERPANQTMREPGRSIPPIRIQALRTERLAIPSLADLGDVVGGESGPPRFAEEPGELSVVGIVQEVEQRVAHRFR